MHVLDCQGLETVCSLITPEVIIFPAQLSMSFTRPLENKRLDLIMATFQKLIIVNVSIGLKGIINQLSDQSDIPANSEVSEVVINCIVTNDNL